MDDNLDPIIQYDIKEESSINETSLCNSMVQDDAENFILPSQPIVREDKNILGESYKDSGIQNEYSGNTVTSFEFRKDTIDETILDESFNSMYAKSTQDDDRSFNRVSQSEDLFGTQTQLYDPDESLLQGTPLIGGRCAIPETPAKANAMDVSIDTPRLSNFMRIEEGDRDSVVEETITQAADTQPVTPTVITLKDENFEPIKVFDAVNCLKKNEPSLQDPKMSPSLPNEVVELQGENIDFFINIQLSSNDAEESVVETAQNCEDKDDIHLCSTESETLKKVEEIVVETENGENSESHNCPKIREKNVNSVDNLEAIFDIKSAGEKLEVEEERKDEVANASGLQERTLSLENFHTAPETTPDTEAVPSPPKEEECISEVTSAMYTFVLEVKCNVDYCKTTNTVLRKEILWVQERPPTVHQEVLENWSDSTDKSKRESISSTGSIYSDKTGLPFPLRGRMSAISTLTTSSTSTSTNGEPQLINPTIGPTLSDAQPWKNECYIPLACDEALSRHLAQGMPIAVTSRELPFKVKKTPASRLSLASKTLFKKAEIDSTEAVLKKPIAQVETQLKNDTILEEPSEPAAHDVKITSLEKSTPKRTRRLIRGKGKEDKSTSAVVSNVSDTPVTPLSRRKNASLGKRKKSAQKITEPKPVTASPNSTTGSSDSTKAPPKRRRIPDTSAKFKSSTSANSVDTETELTSTSSVPTIPEQVLDSVDDSATVSAKKGRRGNGARKRSHPPNSVETATIESEKKSRRGRLADTPVSENALASSSLVEGTKVFARWADRFYYLAHLEEEKGHKWMVKFEDGTTKQVADHFIVPQSSLCNGHVVQVDGKEGFQNGFVTALRSNGRYLVEVGDTQMEVKGTDIRLSGDQFNIIKKDLTSIPGTPTSLHKNSAVDPDNILSDRRRNSAHYIGTPATGSRNRKRQPSQSQGIIEVNYEFTPGLELDDTVVTSATPTSKTNPSKITPKSMRNILKGLADIPASLSEKLGPMPDESNHIFAGLSFLLCYVKTKGSRSARKPTPRTCSNSDLSESEEALLYDKYERFPFHEDYLRRQLTAGGGTVYNRFADIPPENYSNCRLVTNRPNRSAKFLLCLVHGIDIVLHIHIIDACRNGDFTRMKLHHVGWSVAYNRWMDKPRNIDETFKGKHIHLYSKSEDNEADSLFQSFWTVILEKAGASVIKDPNYADVIVTDASLPQDIRETVKAIGSTAPALVSVNWVVESLMHAYPVDSNVHPSLIFNYESSS